MLSGKQSEYNVVLFKFCTNIVWFGDEICLAFIERTKHKTWRGGGGSGRVDCEVQIIGDTDLHCYNYITHNAWLTILSLLQTFVLECNNHAAIKQLIQLNCAWTRQCPSFEIHFTWTTRVRKDWENIKLLKIRSETISRFVFWDVNGKQIERERFP